MQYHFVLTDRNRSMVKQSQKQDFISHSSFAVTLHVIYFVQSLFVTLHLPKITRVSFIIHVSNTYYKR